MLAVGFTVREQISQDILHQGSLQGPSGGGAEMIFFLFDKSRDCNGISELSIIQPTLVKSAVLEVQFSDPITIPG